MAQNETLIQVPTELSDPLQVRKFLLRLVERLDIILGFRGQDPYITKTELVTSAEVLANLPTTISAINSTTDSVEKDLTTLQSAQENLQDSFDNAQAANFNCVSLPTAYNDFNYTGYFTLKGYGQFTVLGSNIVNPPAGAGIVPATTYTVFVSSYLTIGGGAVQEVFITSPTTKTFHKRAGDTSALALSLGWF